MIKETHENQPSPEERLPRDAAERLNAMMARSLRMLDDCAMLAATGKTDPAGAVTAAARLLKSNADVTHALVYAVQGETRHRSIVERVNGGSPGLNPNFLESPQAKMEKEERLRRELEKQINLRLPPEKRFYSRLKPEDYWDYKKPADDSTTNDSAT